MTRLARELRLIPLVALAAATLFVLKLVGLLLDGGYTLASPRTAQAQIVIVPKTRPAEQLAPDAPALNEAVTPPRPARTRSWAQDVFGYPDTTGSVANTKPEAPAAPASTPPKDQAPSPKTAQATPAAPAAAPPPAPMDFARPTLTTGERAVLESLNQRRLELEARAREMDVRESLLNAADKRIEARLQELKELEGRITGAMQKKDEADAARLKGLVTMYENMKAKDAAKIFDRLDLKILVDVVSQINPRRMSDILAQMSAEAAERLTVELAHRAGATDKTAPSTELPKIEGRPSGT